MQKNSNCPVSNNLFKARILFTTSSDYLTLQLYKKSVFIKFIAFSFKKIIHNMPSNKENMSVYDRSWTKTFFYKFGNCDKKHILQPRYLTIRRLRGIEIGKAYHLEKLRIQRIHGLQNAGEDGKDNWTWPSTLSPLKRFVHFP